jgi:hypothetical protein
MPEMDSHLPPSHAEQRVFVRAMGCGVEDFIARFGAETAIRRVKTELRRARRARSRKLYQFWSAMLVRLEADIAAQARHEDTTAQAPPAKRRTGWRPGEDLSVPAGDVARAALSGS